LPKLRNVSGEEVVKILCNKFSFQITGRRGSHVRLSKITPEDKVGKELKVGTLKGILKLAKVDINEFSKYL